MPSSMSGALQGTPDTLSEWALTRAAKPRPGRAEQERSNLEMISLRLQRRGSKLLYGR